MDRRRFPSRSYVREYFPPRCTWPKMSPAVVYWVLVALPIEDAICFALSCKFTLAYLIAIFKRMGIEGIPAAPQPTFVGVKVFYWSKIRLLRQLQNSRWKYCAQCWMLHPRSIWTTQPFWRLDHKVCSNGCDTLGSRKCYLPYAGEFDMCPCTRLNIHHKLQLISLLDNRLCDSKHGIQHLTNRSCECIEMLLHTCTCSNNPIAEVHNKVWFSFSCQDQSLRVRTRFLFDFTKSTPSQLETFRNTRRDVCVRANTGKWVNRFFASKAWGTFSGVDWKPDEWFSWDVRDEGPLEITLNRNLGKLEWPSKGWIRNCRDPREIPYPEAIE